MSSIVRLYEEVRDLIIPEPVFDFWCREFGLLWQRKQVLAKAVKVTVETSDAVSIWLRPNSNFSGVEPGQHINIGTEIDGRIIQRSYSVSGVRKNLFRITARQRSNGLMSSYLNQFAKPGMVFFLGDVWGEITAKRFEQKPMLLLAGGIGITPIISMVESWARSVRKQPVQLIYWGRHSKDLVFVERLKKLAQNHFWFDVKILETHFLDRNTDGSPKLFSDASHWLQEFKNKIPSFDAFACGSEGFVNQVRDSLSPLVRNFSFESFTPILATSQAGLPIQVSLTLQKRMVTIPSGVNLLAALEKAGVRIASGCRRGTCNTCSCKKLDGVVQHQIDKTIHESTDTGFKPCTHTALSDISLEL